ncbi:MAG: RNA-guided endonuclease TnpB family protein [Microcoleaceae cyanobacterium]
MLKAYKYRIQPTSEQKILLAKSFGSARWFYNYGLSLTSRTYKETGKGLSRNDIIKLLPGLKREYEWLTEPPSQVLQQVALDLSSAFLNFFEGRTRYPRFKGKHRKQSIRFPQGCKLTGDYLILPKLRKVYCRVSRLPVGTLKSVTVSITVTGEYYASCLYDDGTDKPKISSDGKVVGIDVGLTPAFAITSDGSKHGSPKYYRKHEKKLAIHQKRLSRKQLKSNNRTKARIKVAKVHQKISRCREDFLHKLSRKLVDENQVIVVENLAVKNMVKNHTHPSGSPPGRGWGWVSDAGWGMFCTMLKYKAEWDGKTYLEIDRFFPSSKTCHVCLNQVESLPLDVREWTCDHCGTQHDRDVNAAINIRDEGLRILSLCGLGGSRRGATGVAGGHLATASGVRVRPSKGTAFVRR